MGNRNYQVKPVTLFCPNCRKPYDLVAITERKRGLIFCPKCKKRLGSVS